MNLGEWLGAQAQAFRDSKDADRLRMATYYVEAYEARESDPDRAYAAFTEGRRLAEMLGEPWWVLFYDNERIEALLHFKRDYRSVLDMAVACVLEVRKPTNKNFPGRYAIWDSLVAAYLGIDPEGHADRIREALDYLEKEIPPDHDGSRYLLLARERIFAMERNDLAKAYECCMRELNLCSTDRTQSRAVHFAAFIYCTLCHIAGLIGNNDSLLEWSKIAEELAQANGHHCEEAEAVAWQAVAALLAGDRGKAKNLYLRATGLVARIKMPPKRAYFDALVQYHANQSDLEGALAVRESELATIVDRGRLLYETRVQIERCELQFALDRLTPAALDAARAAARKLKLPAAYLQRLDELAG